MGSSVNEISDHMFHLGKYLLGHSLEHAVLTNGHPFWGAMGVLHIVQSAETLIKAAIAKDHPLLIFTDLPNLSQIQKGSLTIEQLIERGETVQYNHLPDLLWASTGFEITELSHYLKMGEERNRIQHLAVTNSDKSDLIIKFCIQVIDPVLFEFWGEHFLDDLVIDDDSIFEDEILKDAIENSGLEYLGSLPQPI